MYTGSTRATRRVVVDLIEGDMYTLYVKCMLYVIRYMLYVYINNDDGVSRISKWNSTWALVMFTVGCRVL